MSAWSLPIHVLTHAATKGRLNAVAFRSRSRRREAVEPPDPRAYARGYEGRLTDYPSFPNPIWERDCGANPIGDTRAEQWS